MRFIPIPHAMGNSIHHGRQRHGVFLHSNLISKTRGELLFLSLAASHSWKEKSRAFVSSSMDWVISTHFCSIHLEIHNNCFIFLCRSSLLLFVQKSYHLLFTRPTQHLSFALNHLSWARETNCLNCYLLLLFQCYYYLSTINLLFCDEWHIGLTVFLWASTTLTKVMWCLRYYEIYTLSRLLDICHIGLFYF